mmetsp:Transcript_20476/g.23642  ORF Transcript_20476/g.23642 Transcript_20476/m.23642 type:complete len:137 (+) Transcript_20476:30-440(+)|eukprot:CAMPEP_0168331100 /NCGR_PEP_ID=MMETSP0213-20121227/8133_1 /TAXON_ID=151035 /ORGANISM="Euplotes harpa, Strain FSP1.4" /LENGTH=136 /DNA_ID=CAMNT_0008334813 /DNA_START=20 /DNA_END=430 /DNA_ORIENTATION=-
MDPEEYVDVQLREALDKSINDVQGERIPGDIDIKDFDLSELDEHPARRRGVDYNVFRNPPEYIAPRYRDIRHSAEYNMQRFRQMRGSAGYGQHVPHNNQYDRDNMSYEELLELENRIGNVSKGYTDEEIDNIPIMY